jgi:hypothetical protein
MADDFKVPHEVCGLRNYPKGVAGVDHLGSTDGRYHTSPPSFYPPVLRLHVEVAASNIAAALKHPNSLS